VAEAAAAAFLVAAVVALEALAVVRIKNNDTGREKDKS
jgi:hypothetical protein